MAADFFSYFRLGIPLSVLLFAGCTSADLPRASIHGPFYAPSNHTAVAQLPSSLRRVALLPLSAGPDVPLATLRGLDEAVHSELNRAQRFEVISVSREQLARHFGVDQLNSSEALPPGFLEKLKIEFAVDAVLFVDLTEFSPYPPLAVGLRAKLATPDGAALLWSFDATFNASDPSVANAARKYALGSTTSETPVDLSRGVLQSPARFTAYASSSAFATLPPR